MTYPITVLVVPVEGPIRTETIETAPAILDVLQRLVGGYIEPIELPTGDTAFIDEEGKLKGYQLNPRADAGMKGRLFPGDYIAGDLVVVGPPDDQGETTGANLETAQELFGRIG